MSILGGMRQGVQYECRTVQQLADCVARSEGHLLVDVRRDEECIALRAPGVHSFIPYEQIAERHSELDVDPATPIYLICRSGRRSGIAAAILTELGYTHAYNVTGGMKAWVAAGLPVESGPLPR